MTVNTFHFLKAAGVAIFAAELRAQKCPHRILRGRDANNPCAEGEFHSLDLRLGNGRTARFN